MLHDLFTIEIIGKPQGRLNNFEHNCKYRCSDGPCNVGDAPGAQNILGDIFNIVLIHTL